MLVPNQVCINYRNVTRLFGGNIVTYDLLEENKYQDNMYELRSKITPKTKAIVIISPNNPTGGILNKDVIRSIAEIAIENDILVISDEVYERIIFDNEEHISIASLKGMKERTFTLNGFSKAYSMTGWRLGYIAAPTAYIT